MAPLLANETENPKKEEPRTKQHGSGGSVMMGMALNMAIPWLMFSMISIVFAFAYHHYRVIVWCVVCAWFVLGCMFMTMEKRMRGKWFFYIGLLCVLACVSGSLAGLYNYYAHMIKYWSLDENQTYTNVLPTEPAWSHADAGKIIFSSTARVDTSRAVGFKVNTVYCVAPILDDTQTDRVEYWAAGVDCCPARGDFNCDDAWNPKAKSGVVIPDYHGFFKTNQGFYMKAAKQAEAAYHLNGAEVPLFVRWVSDAQAVQDNFWRQGIGFLIATICIYLLISIIAGAMIQMWSKRKANEDGQNNTRLPK